MIVYNKQSRGQLYHIGWPQCANVFDGVFEIFYTNLYKWVKLDTARLIFTYFTQINNLYTKHPVHISTAQVWVFMTTESFTYLRWLWTSLLKLLNNKSKQCFVPTYIFLLKSTLNSFHCRATVTDLMFTNILII